MPRGELFILSAPSGAGKTTLLQRVFANGHFGDGSLAFSVSHTTRPPRPGEEAGRAYHFVERETFERMISEGCFLEWAMVHGNYYGTSRAEVQGRLETGIDVVLDIDVQGAEQVMERYPEAHSIFILPPSFEVLRSRLEGRASDHPAVIEERLRNAVQEIERYPHYEYVIINDDADRAGECLVAIVLEKRQRLGRMRERVAEVLRDLTPSSAAP